MASYQPVPMEQAYAVYISQTVFGTTAHNFKLPGRLAVPFLSQSSVDRMVLRDIWNLVDPNQAGELNDISQLYVILRLVALMQYGPLAQNLLQNPNMPPLQVMTVTLDKTKELNLNLPLFGTTPIPPPPMLLTIYAQFCQTPVPQQPPATSVNPTSTEAAAAAVEVSASNQNEAAPEGSDDEEFGDFGVVPLAAPGPLLSVDDAFGDLEVMDKPLPALPSVPPPEPEPAQVETETEVDTVKDSSEDFLSATSPSLPITAAPEQPAVEATQVDDEFGDFQTLEVPVEEDSFGDFQSLETPAINPTSKAQTASIVPAINFEQDAFAVETQPASTETPVDNEQSNSESFGDFHSTEQSVPATHSAVFPETAATGTVANVNLDYALAGGAQPVTVSISDAFGDLAVEDAPLPTIPSHDTMSGNAADEDEEFGDFEEPAVNNEAAVSLSLGSTDTIEHAASFVAGTGSSEFNQNSNDLGQDPISLGHPTFSSSAETSSIGDAFGTIDVADEPLPNLASFSAEDAIDSDGQNRPVVEADLTQEKLPEATSGDQGMETDPTFGVSNLGSNPTALVEPISQEVTQHNVSSDLPCPTRAPVERADTSFFSVDTIPASTSDISDYQDATEMGSQMYSRQTSRLSSAASSFAPSDDNDDPFAAFESLAPAAPELPPLSSFGRPEDDNSPDIVTPDQIEGQEGSDSFGDFAGVASGQKGVKAAVESTSSPNPTDEFGDFDHDDANEQSESLGDFDQVVVSPPEPIGNVEEADAFGDFDQGHTNPNDTQDIIETVANSDNEEADMFGDFDEAGVHEEAESSFGDFDQAVTSPPEMIGDDEGDKEERLVQTDVFSGFDAAETNDEVDEFGGFDQGGTSPQSPTNLEGATNNDHNETNRFAGGHQSEMADTLDDQDQGADSFGDFGHFEAAQEPSPIPQHDTDKVDRAEDLTGFASTNQSADPFPTVSETPPVEAEEFGSFDAFSGSNIQQSGAVEDNFFDQQSQVPMPFAGTDKITDDKTGGDDSGPENATSEIDDFGDFDSAPQDSVEQTPIGHSSSPEEISEEQDMMKIKARILSHAENLPEELIRTTVNGTVSFGDCFEGNIGDDLPLEGRRLRRTEQADLLLRLLSTTHSKLTAAWIQVIEIILRDLERATILLKEARSFPKKEQKMFTKALAKYISGIGEMVRVVRMIVATVGDLLMLDPSAAFTVDTFSSSWKCISFLKGALDVESLWNNIESLGEVLELHPVKIDSIVAIRNDSAESVLSTTRCSFTLQPLDADAKFTTRRVLWDGCEYMACCANFLANKCPSYCRHTPHVTSN